MTTYGIWYKGALQVTCTAMYEVILFIRDNLMNVNPTDIIVTETTRQELTANHDMHMADFLEWLGEEHGT